MQLKRNLSILVILGLCLFGSQSTKAGENYFHHLGKGFENSFGDPRWLLGASAIYTLSPMDRGIQNNFQGRLLPSWLSEAGDYWGQGYNLLAGNAFILAENAAANRPLRDAGKNLQTMAEAYIVNGLMTYAIKYTARRLRPDGSNRMSFPSGHTSSSFVVAATLQQLYGDRIGIPAFIMATITGLQRIHADKHWFSDVLSGALLGTLIGRGFAHVDHEEKESAEKVLLVRFAISF